MRRKLLALAAVSAVGVAAYGARPNHVVLPPISVEHAKFQEMRPGVSKAVLWGDPSKGAYGTYTRYAPGHRDPLHVHARDLHIFVLEGAYLFEANGQTIRVGPRSYFTIPGGVPHTNAGDPKDGALFLESSEGKYELKPVVGVGGAGQGGK